MTTKITIRHDGGSNQLKITEQQPGDPLPKPRVHRLAKKDERTEIIFNTGTTLVFEEGDLVKPE